MVRIAGFHPADPGSIPGDEGNRPGKTFKLRPSGTDAWHRVVKWGDGIIRGRLYHIGMNAISQVT
ncbi:uncharacterized protein METZ01_LOCUS445394 [marine metagenome]|uniref:Uncharacterized protein n=1 Tax=marine metagenome TaxID=408172 RepID=A0A382ZB99_9ZZZZ